jgi:hypothetical protein
MTTITKYANISNTVTITAAVITTMIPQINRDVYITKEYTFCFGLLFDFVQYVFYFDCYIMCYVIASDFSIPVMVEELPGFLTSSPSNAKF